MKKYLKYCFVFAGFLSGMYNQAGFCQGWENDKAQQLISEIHESIILQTDRTVYASGEEARFSANCFINGKRPEILLSRVLYVELYGQPDESIFKGKFTLDENGCHGSFLIPEETHSGVYFLRAYTAWMRNFATEDFFTTTITVINPELPPLMVEDWGKNIEIISEDEVTQSLIIITLKNGDTLLKKIPQAKNPAFSFSTTWNHENLVVEMNGKPPVETMLTIVAFSAGYREMYSTKPKSIAQKTTFIIPKEKLAPGLNYLALKDDREQIIRLSVIYHFSQPSAEILVKTDKNEYKSREKVSLQIRLKEENKNVEFTKFSIVVAKRGTMGYSQENTITKAHIENPILLSGFLLQGNYTGTPDDTLIRAICKLQSARLNIETFNNQVKKCENPTLEFLPEIRGVTISGMVRNKETNYVAEGLTLYSSVLFGNPQVNIYKTGMDGRFVFPMHEVTGIQDVFLCPAPHPDIIPDIMVNQDFTASYPELQPVAFPFDSTDAAFLKEIIYNARIRSTFNSGLVSEKKKEKSSPVYFGKEKKVIYLEEYISLKSMKEVFTEIIPVVKVRKSENRQKLIVTDDHANFLPGSPLLLIDNMPVFDAEKVLQIHPSQVDRIEVINRVYVLGDRAINGIIMIFTKTDNFGGIERPSQSVFAEFQTIEKETSFHSPEYLTEKDLKSPMPDFRNLLYWNPEIVLTPTGNTISFYTSDSQGDYEIIIRAIRPDGTQVSGHSFFSVSK